MTQHEHTVRARHLKTILEALAAQPDAATVLAAVPPACRATILDATGIDWVDVEVDLVVTRAAYQALGQARADACFRGLIGAAVEGPLLKPLAAAARALFNLEPRALVHWVPKAWALIFRGCGTWQVVDEGPRRVALTLSGVPPRLADDETWPRSVRATLESVFDLAKVEGRVRHEVVPGPVRALRFRVTWEPRDRVPSPGTRVDLP